MSGRKLGGGRIFGSGKGMALLTTAESSPPVRTWSPFTPSEGSSVASASFPSPSSVSPPSWSDPMRQLIGPQDLASQINLSSPSNEASATSRIVCPICQEEMMTLLQLNRHIDDEHQELPEDAQDEVKTWFDKQVLKAKRFQPLSLINSKLRGLDVFESNESQPITVTPNAGLARTPEVIDPEELVTRRNWQRPTGNDGCTDPACSKRLGPLNGTVNCRKCGRLFCEEHTMYQIRLARSAAHDPVRGVWCRVCETCYKSREAYNDHNGVVTDHTAEFAATRKKRVDRQKLEIQRLEKRLTKLTRLLASAPDDAASHPGPGGLLLPLANTLSGQKRQRQMLEQSVVGWEEDAAVQRCPFCQQEFAWTFRKHHCRICGRVVCSDAATSCSFKVGVSIASPSPVLPSEKAATALDGHAQISLDVRMCRDCKATIFSHRDFADSLAHKPPDQRAYETLGQLERGISQLMTNFQRALIALKPPKDDDPDELGATTHNKKPPPTRAQIQEAAKIRKRLTDAFSMYDTAARRVRDLKTDSPTQQRLQKAVYVQASAFLHANLVPLKHVPRLLKLAGNGNRRRALNNRHGNGDRPSPLGNGEIPSGTDTASLNDGVSGASTALLNTEEKQLREKQVVLEEQKFMVETMVRNARGARRFEEVAALTRNVEELDLEIDKIRKRIGGVESRLEGLYTGVRA